jgi:glycosyltransferase involved in cell wall biosynthesis
MERLELDPVIVNVGRPDPVKNRSRALTIWQRFAARRAARLVMVGALNNDDARRVAVVGELHPGRVVTTGDIDEVAAEIGKADVLLTTSLREGLPGVVLEALAVGVPVVSSQVPGAVWTASQLPGVEVHSLEESDEIWVEAIERAIGADKDALRAAFDVSPFTMENAVGAFCRLWNVTP